MPKPRKRNENHFPKRVKHALIEREWSMTDLAKKVKRPRSTVSRAVHGNQFPIVRELVEMTLFTPTE